MKMFKKFKKHVPYKYNLNKWLWQLETSDDYNAVVKHLAWSCCVSPHTFKKWRYIKQDETAEIPQRAIYKICMFFQKELKDIYTNPEKL